MRLVSQFICLGNALTFYGKEITVNELLPIVSYTILGLLTKMCK